MKKLSATLSLFTSAGTLVCCALPALLVTLGLGASFASLITQFPQLVWLSENKGMVFGVAGAMLALAGTLQYRSRAQACPPDPRLAEACATTRSGSIWIYWISVAIFALGVFFAYVLPLWMEAA